jgi:hypothetical protein
MDLMLSRMFQRQVKFECECVLISARDLEAALAKRDTTTVFCSIQALLGAAANISKALWGVRKTKKALAARGPLRSSLKVPDTSPLNPRKMRDNYEHFDERLEKWWKESKAHNFADMNIMNRSAIKGIADIDRFRAFDPQTGYVAFWGDDFDLRAIVEEVRRILPIATEEASKPHWQP